MSTDRSGAHPEGNAARGMRRANRATALTLACRYLDGGPRYKDPRDYVADVVRMADRFLPWLNADIPGGPDA